jgi:uncharacterized protein (TIGR00297 family)
VKGRWLTGGGAAAALAVGAATVWGTGWRGVALLLAFFVSSSLLTRGGGRRTARQVLANGGVAALAAAAGSWPAFAGAVAAATADTWATEIGGRSRTTPRRITTGAPVPPGTSGGITALGTAAGVLGAGCIGVVAVILAPRAVGPGSAALGISITAAGVAGMLIDSLIGATLQGDEHGVRLDRGYAWLDNDVVNLAATITGAAIAWSVAR